MKRTALLAALLPALALPTAAAGQGGPGFLFSEPDVSLVFRAGYTVPRLDSDIFVFPLDSLTLGKSDFAGPFFGGELAVRLAERWDVALSGGWSGSESRSEYENWVDQDRNPIEQVTRFDRWALTLGGKYYLSDRGRTIGRFAWVPRRFSPYLGGGIGIMGYAFEQEGDFVDFQSPTQEIFRDRLRTTGTGFAGYVNAGTDFSLGKHVFLSAEARYNLGSGGVGGPFSDFERVDLAGLQVTGGIGLRW
ncbi:MAG TPA: outer membrane beta-barrel protein [Longimicrobiales bacterium]|nr:outer membrane beta-barrel protein [Longimicrobiales bacterium]